MLTAMHGQTRRATLSARAERKRRSNRVVAKEDSRHAQQRDAQQRRRPSTRPHTRASDGRTSSAKQQSRGVRRLQTQHVANKRSTGSSTTARRTATSQARSTTQHQNDANTYMQPATRNSAARAYTNKYKYKPSQCLKVLRMCDLNSKIQNDWSITIDFSHCACRC